MSSPPGPVGPPRPIPGGGAALGPEVLEQLFEKITSVAPTLGQEFPFVLETQLVAALPPGNQTTVMRALALTATELEFIVIPCRRLRTHVVMRRRDYRRGLRAVCMRLRAAADAAARSAAAFIEQLAAALDRLAEAAPLAPAVAADAALFANLSRLGAAATDLLAREGLVRGGTPPLTVATGALGAPQAWRGAQFRARVDLFCRKLADGEILTFADSTEAPQRNEEERLFARRMGRIFPQSMYRRSAFSRRRIPLTSGNDFGWFFALHLVGAGKATLAFDGRVAMLTGVAA
eukprot:gnl/Chilomastix_cuspidata/5752.p1 GENE.gnl/Chilomastix_cuspidata/5752~~gnl/Chilomastix_cuspidata/5752.p1  ORF type:complete len:298 (+),score=68.71 gnl/Chilomastix_cuspidata/5752:24-896(+)